MTWLCELIRSAESGEPVVLITVVQATGSTPREVGAKMAVMAETTLGSIGGGQLEFEAVELARKAAGDGSHRRTLLRRILGPDLGQCCGGAISLLIEVIKASDADWLKALHSTRPHGDTRWMLTPEHGAKSWITTQEARLLGAREDKLVHVCHSEIGWRVIERVGGPEIPVLVFGAGHVGTALVKILAELPFSVSWLDSRPDAFVRGAPAGIQLRMTPHLVQAIDEAPPEAIFLIMTHSHELDFDLCVRVLRRSDFCHLGLIGSGTKRARFARRLRDKGFSDGQIDRLACPIGLAQVPGKQPMAIAVAAAAELLGLRARYLAVQDVPQEAGNTAAKGGAA